MNYSMSRFDSAIWVEYYTKLSYYRRKYVGSFDEAVSWIEKNSSRFLDRETCKICCFTTVDYKVVF